MTKKSTGKYTKVHGFLKKRPMAVLSTVSADGTPWGSAIYYVADEDFNFYFITRVETHKYINLDKNPVAAITIADAESQTTVQASGKILKLPLERYNEIVFGKLAPSARPKDDMHWSPPLHKIKKGNYMPLYLVPDRLQFADYKNTKPSPHPDPIKVIIGS